MSTKKKNNSKFNLDNKKLIIIICAVVAIVAIIVTIVLLSDSTVETTVPAKYADGFADKYASSKTVDDNGNVSYEFEEGQYEVFLSAYHEYIKEDSREYLETAHQYTHYNLKNAEDAKNYGVVVGISEESYAEIGEDALKAEAQKLGESAIKYQMNTENPKKEVPVTYRDAGTGKEYFKIIVVAE